ncbi:MAG: phosphatase PAP2 family protein [Acidimicrobiales bacterium]
METTPPEVKPPFPPGHEPDEPRGVTSPARIVLPPEIAQRVRAFDDAVDRALDRVRGRPAVDRTMYVLSELADFSLLWHLLGVAQAAAGRRTVKDAVRLSAVLGVESLLVNGGIKSLFRRVRPEPETPRPYNLRRPLTSSFPSGHASAAFTAASMLSERSSSWPLHYGLAGLVATSRIHVKIHHASDVVGGAAIGLALGHTVRRLWPREHRRE